MITNLDVWLLSPNVRKPGAGNQSLYNTLLGYARAGWEGHMLTNSRVLSDMPPIHDKVIIHRKPMFTSRPFSILKAVTKKSREGLKSGGALKVVATSPKPPSRMNWLHAQVFCRVMARRAVKLARKLGGVDFVYGYEIHGALAGRDAARKLGVPLVTRFQGTELSQFLEQPEKLLSYKTKVEATKIDAALIIMANDGTQGDKVLDFLGIPKGKYRFYMNGVSGDDVYRPDVDVTEIRKKAHVPAENLFLLHTGRFFYFKRIDRLLKVFAKALEEFSKMALVLIGDGPERKACENLVKGLGIASNVVFLGSLPHSEVMDYLNACDIYVAFYDISNLSNSMIESCVCGKCIVTTAIGGTTDLLTDGANAVVVEKHSDVEAITQALIRVLRDPNERARLAEGARKRGSELKTWEERMLMETDEVAKILAGKTGN